MNTEKIYTACFSGYRPEKFKFSLSNKSSNEYLQFQEELTQAILAAIEQGYHTFLCGMAKGFDLLCAYTLLDIQKRHKAYCSTCLVAVLPFAGHRFAGEWGRLHHFVETRSNQVVTVSPDYSPDCYRQRNRYMIDHSDHLICYWDGQGGGTAQTVFMARKHGLSMRNVFC